MVDLPLYETFELLSLHVKLSQISFVFIVIYRPPSPPPSEDFFVDIAMYSNGPHRSLDAWSSATSTFNVDDVTWAYTSRLVTFFDDFGLRDYVRSPTRTNPDHQLDVFITRLYQPAPVIRVDPPIISDHSFVVAHCHVGCSRSCSKSTIRRRRWRSFDLEAFVADFGLSRLVVDPLSDVTELFDSYDTNLAKLLDKHAPWRSIAPKARPSALWFDAECHSAKVTTRRLEKAYRKNPSSATEFACRKQFAFLRTLYQGKFTKHWSDAISSCNGDYKVIWSRLQPQLK